MQGQYGAMLPSGQTGLPPLQVFLNNASNWANSNGPINNPYMDRWQNQPTIPQVDLGPIRGTYGQLYSGTSIPKIVAPATPAPVAPPVTSQTPSNYNPSQRGRGFQNAPVYSQSQGHPDPGLIARIAQNPKEFEALNPAQQDAVERLLTQSAGGDGSGGGAGNNDFMNTGFMQYNTANNVSFGNQLRWSKSLKKYVKIKDIARLERNHRRRVKGNEKIAQANQAGTGAGKMLEKKTMETTGGFTGSFGVVNFNTGTG
jgi:hypothetical protein